MTGAFQRVFTPTNGRYVNDHTLIRGPDGTWHLYGITDTSPGNPWHEFSFIHASAPKLAGPWTEHPDVLATDPREHEALVWAPHIVETNPGHYTMYYRAGPAGLVPHDHELRRADTTDFFNFTRVGRWDSTEDRPPGGRDPMLFNLGTAQTPQWLLFSVGAQPTGAPHQALGQILVSHPHDNQNLQGWSAPQAIITDPVPNYGWGALESPFMVFRNGYYYLFLTRTGEGGTEEPGTAPTLALRDGPGQYIRTPVFRSRNPYHFDWQPITALRSHAGEIVEEDGHTYITSCGWTAYIGEHRRGLSLAPLHWVPAGHCPTTPQNFVRSQRPPNDLNIKY